MTPDQWKQVRDIFDAALEVPAAAREAYLESACAGDTALRAEVEELLASFQTSAGDFLEQPAAQQFGLPDFGDFNGGSEPMEGRRFGAYELLKLVGKGGMGAVYAAKRVDKEFEKVVAIKLMKAAAGSVDLLRRFRIERQVLAGLEHPNIARLLDGGTVDGNPYLVMEFVEGIPIDQYCEQHQLGVNERLQLFQQVCAAVEYAHRSLVVHRDLKPGNILVTAEGVPKLLDFGIAKILRPDFILGGDTDVEATRTEYRPMTPEFASPEQFRGDPVTTASDVYALGVILFRLLTGQKPYRLKTRTVVEIERAVLEEEPERPSTVVARHGNGEANEGRLPEERERLRRKLSGDLDMIVLMALRKEPERRYASVERLSEDIRRYLSGLPVSALPDTWGYRVDKFVRRHPAGVAAAVVVAASLVASTAVSLRYASQARVAQAKAETRFRETRELARFVLFDLDSAIRSGVTPARKTVIERATTYLNRLSADSADDPSLQKEIVEAYLKVGDLQGNLYGPNLGDSGGARESYRKALVIAESLAPSDPLPLAAVTVKFGDLAALGSERQQALESYEKARRLYEQSPAQPQPGLMDVYSKTGLTQLQLGDLGAALESYRRYLRLAEQRVAKGDKSPESLRALAFGNERVGETEARSGAMLQGILKLQRALDLYTQLPPNDARTQRDISSVQTMLGDFLSEQGKHAEAIRYYQLALQRNESTHRDDPRNRQSLRDLHLTLGRLAAALEKAGRLSEARSATVRALAVLRPMVDREDVSEYDLQHYCWLLLTSPFPDLRNAAVAKPYAERLVRQTKGEDARMLQLLAKAQGASGDRSRAAATTRKALALLPAGTSDLRRELEAELAGYQPAAKP